jgi:hypothetical protein
MMTPLGAEAVGQLALRGAHFHLRLAPVELVLEFGQPLGLAPLLPKLLAVEALAVAHRDRAGLPLDDRAPLGALLLPDPKLALGAFHPDALLALGTLKPDALLALGTLEANALLALGTFHPNAHFALRPLELNPLLALRPLDSLRALGADALFAAASLGPFRPRLFGLGRDRLVLVLAAPLGRGRSSDCKRRHGGDQDRPGHHL